MLVLCDLVQDIDTLLAEEIVSTCRLLALILNSLNDSSGNDTNLFFEFERVGGQEIREELKVLVVADAANWTLDHSHELRLDTHAGDSWDQVSVTRDCFQGVDGLEGDDFVFSLEINALVKEKQSTFESMFIIFEEHINQVSQE